MGTAIDSFGELRRLLTDVPAAAGLVGLITALYYVVNYGLGLIPYIGTVLGFVLFVLTLGAMYAITNHAAEQRRTSFESAIDLLSERWLSLLGLSVLLFIVLFTVAFIYGIVFTFLFIFVVLAGGTGTGIAITALLGLLAYLPVAMFLQFFVPAVAIDRIGAIDALGRSVEIVRHDLVSAVGFTLLRWTLEWGPGLLGILAAAAIGWDAIDAVFDEFVAIADDPEAGAGTEAELELLEMLLAQTDPITFAAMVLVVLLGGVIGQVLRIFYTTSFYRNTRDQLPTAHEDG